MRAHFIYEKFIQNSDPIKDLNIGTINLYEKAQDIIYNSKQDKRGLKFWLDYAKTLIGKTISGKFIKGDFGLTINKKIIQKKFKIYRYNSYAHATTIVFYDKKNNPYIVLKNEFYYIK